MTPWEHLELIVRPNIKQMSEAPKDVRLAFNAAAAVDALAAHLYWWAVEHFPEHVRGCDNDSEYRHHLRRMDSDLSLTFDVAKANKHARLEFGKPLVVEAADIATRDLNVDDYASFDDINFSDERQVSIATTDGFYAMAGPTMCRALGFLERLMTSLRWAPEFSGRAAK